MYIYESLRPYVPHIKRVIAQDLCSFTNIYYEIHVKM